MNNEELVNTLQIKTTIDPRTDRKFVQVGSTNYDKFVVVNPKLSTSQSWYNISQSIGNNSFTITNFINRNDINLFPKIIRGALRYTNNTLNKLENSPIITYDEAMLSVNPLLYKYSDKWEIGSISTTTGNNISNVPGFPRIRTIDYIKLNPGCDIASFFNISSPNNGVIIYYYNSTKTFLGVSSTGLSTTNTYRPPLNNTEEIYIRIIAGFLNSDPITPIDIEDFQLSLVSGYAYNSPSVSVVQSNEYRAVCSLVSETFNLFFPVGVLPNYLAYSWSLIGSPSTVPTGTNIVAYSSAYYPNGTAATLNGPVIMTNGSIDRVINDNLTTTSMILQLSKYIGTTITPMFLEDVSLVSNMPTTIKWSYALLPAPGTYADIRKVVTIPDGYYNGIDSTPTQAGFQSILDKISSVWATNNFTIELAEVPSYKVIIGALTPVTLFFSSTDGLINRGATTTLDTSAPILGWPNHTNFVNIAGLPISTQTNPVFTISPLDFDLFTEGRFYACNINLSLLHTTGFINESSSIITFDAKGQYGQSIVQNDISYQKILPYNLGSIQNFTLSLTDAFDKPILLDDRIFIRFEIQCYRKKK